MDGSMKFVPVGAAKVYLVHLRDEKQNIKSHRLFSSPELAAKFINNEPCPLAHHFTTIERDAHTEAVIRLKKLNQ
jgi:hypothetical protein